MAGSGSIEYNYTNAHTCAESLRITHNSHTIREGLPDALRISGVRKDVQTVLSSALSTIVVATADTKDFALFSAGEIDKTAEEAKAIDAENAKRIRGVAADFAIETQSPEDVAKASRARVAMQIALGDLNEDGSPRVPSGPGHRAPRITG